MRFLIESLPVDPLLADEWVPAGVWVLSDDRDECVVRYTEDDPPSIEAAKSARETVRRAFSVSAFLPEDFLDYHARSAGRNNRGVYDTTAYATCELCGGGAVHGPRRNGQEKGSGYGRIQAT
ncbi:MAG: hypothetical protein DIKNOCCD_01297 [bacterium]|nr:hypothetical protein [bacterium]